METWKRQDNDDVYNKMPSQQTCFNLFMENWTRSFIITVFTMKIFVNNSKAQLDRNTQ